MTRCILCYRCVRGRRSRPTACTACWRWPEIGTYIENIIDNEFSGNVIDVCPLVGAR
jgi:NADH-quinone oxidoreductase subunit G